MARSALTGVTFVGGVAVGTGVGNAVGGAIAPAVQTLQNDAWSAHAVRPVAAGLVAAGVGEGKLNYAAAAAWAKQQGYDTAQFDAMVAVAETGPGLGEAFRLWRRDLIGQGGFRRAAKRLGIEEEWLDALVQTRQEPLDPAVLAAGIVRGLIPDPGILPVGPPSGTGRVPRFPVFNVDAIADAKWAGIDRERLSVMVGNYGRPMSPEAAAAAVFKHIIDRIDFDRAIAEGDVRNEWADSIFENQRFVLSPQDGAGLRLRGWKTKAEAEAIGALHGATPETMENLYLNRGRPATVHQVHIGYARGGAVQGAANEREAVHQSVVRSDIRPEFEDVLWAGRYTYPSAFVIRALTQDGTFSRDVAHQTLLEMGWKPDLATLAADAWSGGGTTSTATPWANRARGRLYTVTHNEFMADAIDEPTARQKLAAIGIGAAEVDTIINLWVEESQISRLELTPAQIRKAYKKGIYTYDEAFGDLEQRGMTPADADTFLQSG